MSVKLTIERQTLQFETDSVGIGSATDNLIALPGDARLAPRHAVLKSVNGRWILEVLDGCPVRIGDGRPVRFAWLNTGDVIHLTETGPELQFEAPPSPAPQVAASTPDSQAVTAPPFKNAPFKAPETKASPRTPAATLPAAPPVAADESAVSAGTWRPTPKLLAGGALSLALVAVVWGVWPRNHHAAPAPVVSTDPEPQVSAPDKPAPTADPQECLVLVGIGDLRSDNRPHILGVGWLWNDRTAVVPRTLGDTLSELIVATDREGEPRQACVIQGVPLEVGEITHPSGNADISLAHLKQPAELASPMSQRWRRVTAADIERLRSRSKSLSYLSYAPLPRSPKLRGTHGFSLHPYDPESVRLTTEEARLLYEQRRHHLKSDDPVTRLERGGLLLDPDQKIVGMTLLDSSIVWTDALEAALGTP